MPTPPSTPQNVIFSASDAALATNFDTDGAPTSANPPAGNILVAGKNGQVTGTAGTDRASLETLRIDKDQIVNLGAGDDVFIFRSSGSGRTEKIDGVQVDTYDRINGIVDGGSGSDTVYANGSITDYQFSIRSDGGIKMEYIGGDVTPAVTFRNFESFVFRNIDGPSDAPDQTFTYDNLIAAIIAAANNNM